LALAKIRTLASIPSLLEMAMTKGKKDEKVAHANSAGNDHGTPE
jgi:hypothetical protein